MYSIPTAAASGAPAELFVARQPILDANRSLVAYELLFRTGSANIFPAGTDPDEASKRIIGQTISVFGLDALVGDKIAYVNVTQRILTRGTYACFPPGRVVLELLETLRADEETLAACAAAKSAGYVLALDDYSGQTELAGFLPHVGVIKVDFRVADEARRREIAERFAGKKVQLLAEKVETAADFNTAREMGYQYFQGFFFCRPEMISRNDIPVSKVTYLQFLKELSLPELDFGRLERVIKQDVGLSLKLLRYLKAAAFGWRSEITSIKQALSLLGERPFRRWASLLVIAVLSNDRPAELLPMCLVRARFCESLASELGLRGRELDLFLVGLLSLMDAVVERPLAELLDDIALPADLVAALLPGPGSNRMRDALSLVIAYERAAWDEVETLSQKLNLRDSAAKLPGFYQDALT
ncbi:MAG TPA: HDOD domain-containing protein, partial [Polyangiales bacterium]|nr:HDOD domain-containing protein [Polyangiales bacterium]